MSLRGVPMLMLALAMIGQDLDHPEVFYRGLSSATSTYLK